MIGVAIDLPVWPPDADSGRGDAVVATTDLHLLQVVGFLEEHLHLVGDDSLQIAGVHRLFFVGHLQEAVIDLLELLFVQRVAQFGQPVAQPGPARPRRQDDLRVGHTYVVGADDLIGGALLQHAVLVDAGGVREGVGSHDGLVRLHRDAGQLADQTADRVDEPGVDGGLQAKEVVARPERHDHLLQRGVACPFADAIHGHLHLTRAVEHAGQRVGRGHSQVVVAVDRDNSAVDIGHVLDDGADECTELVGRGVTGGVRDVDDRGPGGDDRLQHAV